MLQVGFDERHVIMLAPGIVILSGVPKGNVN